MSDDKKDKPVPLSDTKAAGDAASAGSLRVRSTAWLQSELRTAKSSKNLNHAWIAALQAELAKRS